MPGKKNTFISLYFRLRENAPVSIIHVWGCEARCVCRVLGAQTYRLTTGKNEKVDSLHVAIIKFIGKKQPLV